MRRQFIESTTHSCKHDAARPMARCSPCKNEWKMMQRAENPEKYLWECAKHRAKRERLPFSIEVADVHIPSLCPVLGIPLDRSDRDHTPTLDEHVQGLGYVRGNVYVISGRANRLKSDASVAELERIARYARDGASTPVYM